MRLEKPILIEVSPGDLLDKISILNIKKSYADDPSKRQNIDTELNLFVQVRDDCLQAFPALDDLAAELEAVNKALWGGRR